MEEKITGPAYRIETEHLVIRCWNPDDAPLLKAAIDASIDHLLPYLPWAANEPKPLQAKIDLIRKFRSDFDGNSEFVYGIFNQDETCVVGGTGLHTRAGEKTREIGYWIHTDQVRQGYATETAAALTKVAFVIDQVERVDILCNVDNIASNAVARKLGYTLDARLRRRLHEADGKWCDAHVFSMFADEYAGSPAAVLSMHIRAFDAIDRLLLGA